MKFHFNGGLDAPEWLLAQISEISKIGIAVFKKLCLGVADHLQQNKPEWTESEISIFDDAKTATGLRAVKAIVAVLTFVVEKATKYDCSEEDLEAEMLQLGMPSGHANALVEVYGMKRMNLKEKFSSIPFKEPSLGSISGIERINAESGKQYFSLRTQDSNGATFNFVMAKEQLEEMKNGLEHAIDELDAFKEDD